MALNDHIYFASGSAKTVCVSHMLAFFGIAPHEYRKTWNGKRNVWDSILRRNGYAVRSRKSSLPATVGAARRQIGKLTDPPGTAYVIRVPGHVLVVGANGETLVDTDPRKRDRRRIVGVYAVWPK